jgi:RNA polymerase sigma factor (sigma-70 family)
MLHEEQIEVLLRSDRGLSEDQVKDVVSALEVGYGATIRGIVGKAIRVKECGAGGYDEDDVVQDTMSRVTRELKDGKAPEWLQQAMIALSGGRESEREDEKRIRGWLKTIALHILTDLTRRRQAATVDDAVWWACAECTADPRAMDPTDVVADHEAMDRLDEALASLDRLERKIVKLYQEHESFRKVAAALELPTETVREKYWRALSRLRTRLENREDIL